MVKMRFSTILFTSQRLHVKEYHKTQKYLSNARQAMEVIEKTIAQVIFCNFSGDLQELVKN